MLHWRPNRAIASAVRMRLDKLNMQEIVFFGSNTETVERGASGDDHRAFREAGG